MNGTPVSYTHLDVYKRQHKDVGHTVTTGEVKRRIQRDLPDEVHLLTAVLADGLFNVRYEDGVAA